MNLPHSPNQLKKAYGPGGGVELSEAKQRELALRYLPIVKNELSRLRLRIPRHLDADDLYGVALTAMMRSLQRWTAESDKTFGVYLRKRIRGALLDELRRLDVFSRSARKKAKEYDEAVGRLEQRLRRTATEEDIRGELSLSKKEFDDLMEVLRPVTFLSLDAPLSDDANSDQLSDILDDPVESNAREQAEMKDQVSRIRERIRTLPQDQQRVLHLYYFKELRLAEIADVFKVSESRVCQLHTQAIRSLKITVSEDN
ncbi:MAG: sigma-70 family RNA polymerase sigma factor [Opitutales bacterium]